MFPIPWLAPGTPYGRERHELTGYCDTDTDGAPGEHCHRDAISGYAFLTDGGAVSRYSRKQEIGTPPHAIYGRGRMCCDNMRLKKPFDYTGSFSSCFRSPPPLPPSTATTNLKLSNSLLTTTTTPVWMGTRLKLLNAATAVHGLVYGFTSQRFLVELSLTDEPDQYALH